VSAVAAPASPAPARCGVFHRCCSYRDLRNFILSGDPCWNGMRSPMIADTIVVTLTLIVVLRFFAIYRH
jgi:hypothetical protein